MAVPQIDVSIIIVNYRSKALVDECLKSVVQFTHDVSYEVIVVDNASGDGVGDMLQTEFGNHPEFHFIQLADNVGFGRANNAGFDVARGRYLFCLNPDTLLLNNAVKILTDFLDSHPDAGACGGNLFNANMQPTLSFRRFFPGIRWELNEFLNLKPEKLVWGINRDFNHTDRPMQVAYITGADLMLRREAVDQCGAFRKEFFMYYEETDLCRRILHAGWKIYSVPDARIQHLEGGTFKNSVVNKARIFRSEKGRDTYFILNYRPLARHIANALHRLTVATRCALLKDSPKAQAWHIKKAYLKKGDFRE